MRRWALAAAGAALVLAAASAWAQTNAGQFLTVVGDVRVLAADGSQRVPQRGMLLREGETVLTGAGALAQVRLLDGGVLAIRADTEMKIDRFAHTGSEDRNSSLLISLLKGGFRSITGLIGQLNREGYRITTPTATIGIRGTDHEPVVVRPDTAAQLQLPPGTYDKVNSGMTTLQNLRGDAQTLGPNQIGFVSLQGAAPVLLPAVPTIYRVPTPVPQTSLPPQQPGGGPGRAGAAAKGADLRDGGPALREGLRTSPRDGRAGGAEAQRLDPGAAGAAGTRIAPIQTAPIQTVPSTIQTAPTTIQTSPIQTAPIQTAPIQTAPMQTAPMQTAPMQTAPMQTAPIQTAPIQTAPTTIR